jgi:hypothetical protein
VPEEVDEQGVVDKGFGWVELAEIHVDDIGERLERINEMPGGSRMCSSVMFTGRPTAVNEWASESAKKLKYLKKLRKPRLRATDTASRSFRRAEFCEVEMARAEKKSTRVESRMRPRKRQSHQP